MCYIHFEAFLILERLVTAVLIRSFQTNIYIEFSEKFILLGVSQNLFTDKVLDLTVLLFKFYIYKCKRQEIAPNFNVFLRIIKDRYTVERYLHIISDKRYEFDTEWLPYKAEFILSHFYITRTGTVRYSLF